MIKVFGRLALDDGTGHCLQRQADPSSRGVLPSVCVSVKRCNGNPVGAVGEVRLRAPCECPGVVKYILLYMY